MTRRTPTGSREMSSARDASASLPSSRWASSMTTRDGWPGPPMARTRASTLFGASPSGKFLAPQAPSWEPAPLPPAYRRQWRPRRPATTRRRAPARCAEPDRVRRTTRPGRGRHRPAGRAVVTCPIRRGPRSNQPGRNRDLRAGWSGGRERARPVHAGPHGVLRARWEPPASECRHPLPRLPTHCSNKRAAVRDIVAGFRPSPRQIPVYPAGFSYFSGLVSRGSWWSCPTGAG